MLFNNSVQKLIKERLLFGNEPTPELLALLCVYFVQGILGLARLAVSFFLKDDLGLTPAEVAALTGVAAFPWVIKPFFGFLSDALPLFGYRRRSYLVLSGILGTLGWLALATVAHSALTAMIALLVISISVAIADVIADSLVVERARGESQAKVGSLQSLSWGCAALGGLITAYLSGWLLQQLSNQAIFQITAIFPLIVTAIAGLISEQPQEVTVQPKQGVSKLWSAVRQRSIWLPTAFIFIWQATPNAESAFFFFLTNELDFQPEFLGRVRLVTSIATLLGIWLYQHYLKDVPFRIILGWTSVIASVVGLSAVLLVTHANRAIGIDDHWFSLGDSLVLTVMGQIAFMPILVLSARLCPPGVEATLFALLMSVMNLSGLLSNEIGALLTHLLGVTETNFDKLWLLLVITNLSNLLPLPFLGWLPSQDTPLGNEPSLPPAEVWEGEQSFLPDVFPELIKSNNK
ncbi:folate/biopterin family MFS transporter [Gloeocapsa sp. PCC 73106]|uniref:folate/biopterin family MFS transporter n=1 Tax=Gloeocapsa sp. PCC 73106 TaxID=102232 RepID=UPI0002AC88B4|nr:folate/biopterin family MFS transporter [Gloeocapsa sp. PCC 73106]ELR98248.1 folate/biopterin transporter [Gloeocapsa sp. PCC 73106]